MALKFKETNLTEDKLKKIEDLERQIIEIQKSTRTTWTPFIPLHNFLRMRFRWYYQWHVFSYASLVHFFILLILIISLAGWVYFSWIAEARAATLTWDGGGTDATCGNEIGDGNKWSCPYNWSNDIVPSAGDVVVFDELSLKDSVVDNDFEGVISGLSLNHNYKGAITLSRSLQIAGNYTQSGGKFSAQSQRLAIDGNLSLIEGEFTASSETTLLGGDYVQLPQSIFNHNNGTLVFNGETASLDGATDNIFYNATFVPTDGSIITISDHDTFTVLGTLSLSDGFMNQESILPTGSILAYGDIIQSDSFDGGTAKLIIRGEGAQTLRGNRENSTGDLTEITINKPSGILTLIGTIRTSNPIRHEAGTVDATSQNSTIVFAGEQTISGSYHFDNVVVTNSAMLKTLGSDLTVEGDFTIDFGKVDVSNRNYNLTVGGNWNNTGEFIARSATVTLNGNDQSISGTTSFYNLTKKVADQSSLTFEANKIQTVANILNFEGVKDNPLALLSSIEGTQWLINSESARTIAYLDVKDSYNTIGTLIDARNTGSIDSGNNIGWIFDGSNTVGEAQIISTPSSSQTQSSAVLESAIIENRETVINDPTQEQRDKQNTLTLRVVDDLLNPIANTRVTLHSEPQSTITSDEGIAHFDNVAAGQHRIVSNYRGQTSENIISLTPSGSSMSVSQFNLTLQLNTSKHQSPYQKFFGGIVLIISFLFIWMIINRKKYAQLSGSIPQKNGN